MPQDHGSVGVAQGLCCSLITPSLARKSSVLNLPGCPQALGITRNIDLGEIPPAAARRAMGTKLQTVGAAMVSSFS